MQRLRPVSFLAALALFASAPLGCTSLGEEDEHGDEHDDHGDEDGHDHGETEVISRVQLTFTPGDGGDAIVAAFSDPDGDGGMSGTAEAIELMAGVSYSLSLELLNDLEDPAEDITEEIRAEAEEHLVLMAEEGGLLTIAYDDLESDYGANAVGDDLPVGLMTTVDAGAAGSSNLRVMLRHLPELNGEPQKTADLPDLFASGGDLPGDVDVDVTFELTVI